MSRQCKLMLDTSEARAPPGKSVDCLKREVKYYTSGNTTRLWRDHQLRLIVVGTTVRKDRMD